MEQKQSESTTISIRLKYYELEQIRQLALQSGMAKELYYLAYKIGMLYSDRHQIMFSVHEDTNHDHIHFVMNTVSHVDGKMLSEGPVELLKLKQNICSIIDDLWNDIEYQMIT